MNAHRFAFIALILISTVFTGCRKEKTPEPAVPAAATPAKSLAEFREKYRSPKQLFTADASVTIRIKGAQGFELRIPRGSLLTTDSQVVTGTVQIELIEIFNTKDLLLHDRIGHNPYGMLKSQGMYYLRIRQNGQLLQGYAHVTIPARAGSSPVTTKLYYGAAAGWNPEEPQVFYWQADMLSTQPAVQDSVSLSSSGTSQVYSREVKLNSYSWRNLALRWPASANLATPVRGSWSSPAAAEPELFVAFDSYLSVRRLYPSDSLFGPMSGGSSVAAPIGESAMLIGLQYEAGKFYFGKTAITVTRNKSERVVLREISEADLLAELTALY